MFVKPLKTFDVIFFILLTGNWTTLKMLLPSPTQNFNNFKLKRKNQIHNYLFIIMQAKLKNI